MNSAVPGAAVSDAEYVEIQRFMHHEAALLDRREFMAWLDLLTDDIGYRISMQVARQAEAGPEHYAIIDENADSLTLRVRQLADPRLTRAENPPSLTRRFVSNLEARHAAPPDTFAVATNLLVHRARPRAQETGTYVGGRRDVLRRSSGKLLLAERHVRLDHTILRDGSLSTLL